MKTIITIQMRTCPPREVTRRDAILPPGIMLLATLLLFTAHAIAQGWRVTGSPTYYPWRYIAISADGAKLVATGQSVGLIYASTDSGTNWHPTGAPQGLWDGLASSADGTKLLAVGSDYRYLTNGSDIYTLSMTPWVYTSTNSGTNWARASVPLSGNTWSAAAASADGRKLVIGAVYGEIYTSTNGGGNWTRRSAPTDQMWSSIASSADGTRLVAVAPAVIGGMFTSVDSGATWFPTGAPGDLYWWDVASSADGDRLVAVANRSIYISANGGTNWVMTGTPSNRWVSVASSADATTLTAVGSSPGGLIGISRDFEATWTTTNPPTVNSNWTCEAVMTTNPPSINSNWTCVAVMTTNVNSNWSCVAVSADGNKIFAGKTYGNIYTSQTPATPQLEMNVAGGAATLSWIIPSMKFGLQESPDGSAINWTDVLTQPTSTNYRHQVILSPPSGNRFYRLQSY